MLSACDFCCTLESSWSTKNNVEQYENERHASTITITKFTTLAHCAAQIKLIEREFEFYDVQIKKPNLDVQFYHF